MTVYVEARDTNLESAGEFTWYSLTFTKRLNQVGSWELTMPATVENWELATLPNVGVYIDWNGLFTLSGFAEGGPSFSRSADDEDSGTGVLTLRGADDLAIIANRIGYADPTLTWENQVDSTQTPSASHDVQTDTALETVIKYYVDRNVGPSALALRKHPKLTIAADQARGSLVSRRVRFGELMTIFRELIAAGGPMGMDIAQSGSSLVFDVYVPRDLTEKAWFSFDLGSLRAVELSSEWPTVTNALVGGGGTGTARVTEEVTGAGHDNPWKHIEQFVDDSSTNPPELQQSGKDAIAEGAERHNLAVEAVDLPKLTYGVNYGLGDKVTVEIIDGVTYADVVTQVELSADADGFKVTPTIGNPDAGTSDEDATARLAAEVRDLRQQLKQMQTEQ